MTDIIARGEYAIEHGSSDALHRQLVAELKATRAQLDRRNQQVLCPHSIIESFDIEPPILVCCDCGADCSIGRPRVLDPDPLEVRRDG